VSLCTILAVNTIAMLIVLAGVAHAEEQRIVEYPVPDKGSVPKGIAAGPDGNLWFTEEQGNRIGRITPSGEFLEFPIPTLNSGPQAITAGPDGALWFTEATAGKIGRITTSGSVIEFPLASSAAEPVGIAPGPDGNLWFTERSFGGAIGRISPSGDITDFPLGSEPRRPSGIAAGPDGNLWFNEEQGSRVGEITPGGKVTEYPLPAFSNPGGGITAGPDGNVWFSESQGIGRITSSGGLTLFPAGSGGFSRFAGITAGPDGNLWFTDATGNAIGRITPSGAVTSFTIPRSFPESVSPAAITAGPGGYLWFTESAGNMIGRLDPGGPVPVLLKPPSITGQARIGSKLTAHPGLWTNSPTRYSYLWQDCDPSGGSCRETTRGHGYRVSNRDRGHTIRVFVIARNLGGGSVPAESGATLLVRGPAEQLFLGGSVHRLSLMGSGGYRISLSSYISNKYHRITLSAEKNGSYASYSVKGKARNGKIDAVYPGLGQVSVHFVPANVMTLPPHPGCRGPSGAVERGAFVGTIRFRGEQDFTSVDTGRAHGTIVKHFRQLCRVVKAAVARCCRPRRIEEVGLDATSGAVHFTADNRNGEMVSYFRVKSSERRRGVYITRGAPEVKGKAFTYDDHLTQATVAPPPPFEGTADYSGSADPPNPIPGSYTRGTLLGSLRVFLPGLGVVPLATAKAAASLSRSVGIAD
jgi:streptogramin lyase